MTTFGIAGLQLELTQGDNFERVADEVRSAKRRFDWLQMIVLPELCAFGSSPDHAQTLPGDAEDRFGALAGECGIWLVNGSLFEVDGDAIYNTASVFDPSGRVVARHRKLYPFCPYETGVSAGEAPAVFDVPGVGRFGVAICYDIWFPEVARTLAWQGAEVILNTVMTNTIDRDAEIAMVRATAAQNQLYVVSVNIAGDLGYGRSCVAGPGGEVVHLAGGGREIIAMELDLDHVRRCRTHGWQRLGQVLKSFRDGPQTFAPYAQGPAASPALRALGPIISPKQEDSDEDATMRRAAE